MEIMKQQQYSPIPVDEQVVSIYAATNGFMDDLPLEHVRRYEVELIEFIRAAHSNVLETISMKKEITDDAKTELNGALTQFTERFKATLPQA